VPTLGLLDPTERLRRILRIALRDCVYVASRAEEGRQFVLDARRSNGKAVQVRFRGVHSTEIAPRPAAGAPLRIASIRSGRTLGSLLGLLLPWLRVSAPAPARVTIAAGEARIEVVCEDAEWWEDDSAGSQPQQ
jgi:hypothetical protein